MFLIAILGPMYSQTLTKAYQAAARFRCSPLQANFSLWPAEQMLWGPSSNCIKPNHGAVRNAGMN